MFTRVPRAAHVCLRCQRDLVRKRPRWNENPSRPFLDTGSVRHQSAAAAKPADEYDDHEAESTAPASEHDGHANGGPTPLTSPLFHRYRRVRPSPTAGLGVQSLGKPSEIILLPSHDRVIPDAVDYEDGPRQDLSAAIESEKAPPLWDQVKEYIEATRGGLETQQGPLSIEEWDALKLALKRGFSRIQLRRFLNEHARGKVEGGLLDDAGRTQLAALIATEVWDYQLPHQDEEPSSSEPVSQEGQPAEPEKVATKTYTNEHELLVLQRDTAYGFQALTRKHAVSIAVQGSTVTIRGTKSNVAKAEKWLKTRTSRAKKLDLAGFSESLFSDRGKKELAELIRRIGTDRGIVLNTNKSGNAIQARYMQASKPMLVEARRDLRLIAEDRTRPSSMASPRPERVRFAPYFTHKSAPRFADSKYWGRAFDTVAAGSSGTTRRAEAGTGFDQQWAQHKKQLDHPLQDATITSPNSVRCEYSARFGMNLYNLDHSISKYTGLSNPRHESWFVNELPLLPQLLARQDFRTQAPIPANGDVPIESPFLLKLLMKPVSLGELAPSVEIYLYGKDPDAGVRQTLNVARITAIFETKTRHISIPALPVDISIQREIKQDLFVHHSPTTSQHIVFLKNVGDYLAKARTFNDQKPEFWSFDTLKVPSNLVNLSESEQAVKAPSRVEYVLAAVEAVTSQARLTPSGLMASQSSTARPVLEHLVFSGNKWGPDREEVRVAAQPLLVTPAMGGRGLGLDDLWTVSFEIAERFGDIGRQLRHRMQAIK